MTKCERFVQALEALCREHEAQLAIGGYDSLQVWDLKAGEDPLHVREVVDRTTQV